MKAGVAEFLAILQIALTALETIPAIGADAQLAAAFLSIIQNTLAGYTSAAGQPLDLSKVPQETKVP
jgi:hypothetical protein